MMNTIGNLAPMLMTNLDRAKKKSNKYDHYVVHKFNCTEKYDGKIKKKQYRVYNKILNGHEY